ncbi:MAG: hypothetical protein HKL91_04020 [Candidatus Eremiobacteraeota bacterium]|nr:hypothetical protein [Candidatus Eremiobacteraeota bacterium]
MSGGCCASCGAACAASAASCAACGAAAAVIAAERASAGNGASGMPLPARSALSVLLIGVGLVLIAAVAVIAASFAPH